MARILQVANTEHNLVKFLAPLIRGLCERGHHVECAASRGTAAIGGAVAALGPDVRLHDFEFGSSPVDLARAVSRLRVLIRAGRYEAVVSHNRQASVVARLAAGLERVSINLYTAHGFYFHDDQGWLKHAACLAIEAALARVTHHTFSQSRQDVEKVVGLRIVSAARITHIGNGIDVGSFRPREAGARPRLERELGLNSGCLRIASTGRLVRAKGLLDVVHAFARARGERSNLELVLIGGVLPHERPDFVRELESEITGLGLGSSVVVTGLTDRVQDYLAASDLFVLGSYREGLPRALLEAMATGLPVVATSIRGCREVVAPGENGYLYAPHDVESLARLMRDLLADPERRESLGRRARERVVAEFDEAAYVARQIVTLERLLRSSTPANTSGISGAEAF